MMDYLTNEIDKNNTPLNINIGLSNVLDTFNFYIFVFKSFTVNCIYIHT